MFIRAVGPGVGGGGGYGESGEDAVEEEGGGGVWWGTWNEVGVAVAALEKALLDGAGEGDNHLGWAAELGGFDIDAARAQMRRAKVVMKAGRDMSAASRCPCGGVHNGFEEAVGRDAWRCMRTVHEDVVDVLG